MIVGMKRPSFFEEIYGKRYRVDSLLDLAEDSCCSSSPSSASVEDVIAVVEASVAREKRRACMDDTAPDPAEKRLRFDCQQHPCEGAEGEGGSRDTKQADIKRWSEAIVHALHGCPSVEEAGQRCARVLAEVESDVRQSTLHEVGQTTPPQQYDDRPQSTQPSSKVLMRAVYHLAERCKRLEASSDPAVLKECAALRQQLEQSQVDQRRLTHSNEMLKTHLRLHLDECGSQQQTSGHILH